MKIDNSTATVTFLMVFVFLLVMLGILISPFINPLMIGGILAGIFYSFNLKIKDKCKCNQGRASIITTILIILFVIIPFFLLALQISKEMLSLYQVAKTSFEQGQLQQIVFGKGLLADLFRSIASFLDHEFNLQSLKIGIMENMKLISTTALKMINSWVGNALLFLFDVFIMVLALYGFLTYGSKIKEFVFHLSPIPDDQEQLLLSKFNQMNYVTLVCNGVGGIIQGSLAGVVLGILGVKAALMWTALMIILAFIPIVGISFITVPISLYLFLTGAIIEGFVLLISSTSIALVVENIFKPRFIGARIKLNSLLVFFLMLGGMVSFGALGIFYGPLIGIVFLTATDIYFAHYLPKLTQT